MTRTIVLIAANPRDTPPLRLDEEMRDIANGLERAKNRNEFTLRLLPAARPIDVRRMILDHKPAIVHFCGHGEGEEGITFEDDSGNSQIVRLN